MASSTVSAEPVDAPQVQLGFKQSSDVADAETGKAVRKPRRIVYFQNGEELEEYSTDEEEEIDQLDVTVQKMSALDWKSMPWSSYFFNAGIFGLIRAVKGLEYAGEILSYKLGITSPKYQSEIEEAARMEAEEEEERQRKQMDDASWNPKTGGGESPQMPATPTRAPPVAVAFNGTSVSMTPSTSNPFE